TIYLNRYGTEERSLVEVLDEECGIGYRDDEVAVVNDAVLELGQSAVKQTQLLPWTPIAKLLFDKTIAAASDGRPYINIGKDDLECIENLPESKLPPSMAVIFRCSFQPGKFKRLHFERAVG